MKTKKKTSNRIVYGILHSLFERSQKVVKVRIRRGAYIRQHSNRHRKVTAEFILKWGEDEHQRDRFRPCMASVNSNTHTGRNSNDFRQMERVKRQPKRSEENGKQRAQDRDFSLFAFGLSGGSARTSRRFWCIRGKQSHYDHTVTRGDYLERA